MTVGFVRVGGASRDGVLGKMAAQAKITFLSCSNYLKTSVVYESTTLIYYSYNRSIFAWVL